MEATGLILAGPMGDVFNARNLLAFQSMTICATMMVVSLTKNVFVILLSIAVVTLVKGILWPCVGSVIVSNMSPGKRSVAFLIVSTASRLADTSSSLLLGFLMGRLELTWRHALSTELSFVLLILVRVMMIAPNHIAGPGDKEPSAYGFFAKWKRLITDPNGWLAFGSVFGTYFVWTLVAYTSVMLKDVYQTSVAVAVGASSAMPIGQFLGLLVGALASQWLSPSNSHLVHIGQGCIGVLALLILASRVSFSLALALLVAVGFGFVILSYLPYFSYAQTAPETERAFRLGLLDGIALGTSMLISDAYGRLRLSSETQDGYAPKLFLITAGGLLLSIVCTATLYSRLGQFPCARRTVPA